MTSHIERQEFNPPHVGRLCFHIQELRRSELRWHALNYQLDPSPVVSQRVDFQRKDFIQPEPVTDVVKEAPSAFGISNLFGAQERAAEKEAARRRIADSWGVWVWLIAELIPDGELFCPLSGSADPSPRLSKSYRHRNLCCILTQCILWPRCILLGVVTLFFCKLESRVGNLQTPGICI